jgi:hypothetical protein
MRPPVAPTLALALAGLCLSAAVGIATDTSAPARPALAGSWTLNAALSTPPGSGSAPDDEPLMEDPLRTRPCGPGSDPGLARPGEPHVPSYRGACNGSGPSAAVPPRTRETSAAPALVQELLLRPPMLTIAQAGDAITFTDADGAARTYIANDRTEKHQHQHGTIETKTRWDRDALVMELKADRRLTITRRFVVKGNPRQLAVMTSYGGLRRDAQPMWVYDAAAR